MSTIQEKLDTMAPQNAKVQNADRILTIATQMAVDNPSVWDAEPAQLASAIAYVDSRINLLRQD